MAQDFHALFPLNPNDRMLEDADLHGVELAAIQGLDRKLEEKEARIQKQETEIHSQAAEILEHLQDGIKRGAGFFPSHK